MAMEIMDRLRRALGYRAEDSEAVRLFSALQVSLLDNLSDEHAALFESILEPYVLAAEQLPEDADIAEIVALAKSLSNRKN